MLARDLKLGQLFMLQASDYVFICLSTNHGFIDVLPIWRPDLEGGYDWEPNLEWTYSVEPHKFVFLVDAEFFVNGKPVCANDSY